MAETLTAPTNAGAVTGERKRFVALALGATGVVYGDIGTSPLYALRESIAHVAGAHTGIVRSDVIGIVSLMIWTLIAIVTLKYAFILLRLDNKGEGGVLSLMALVRRSFAKPTPLLLLLGMAGAGLFYGDALLTPAISVLSAVEGLAVLPGLEGRIEPFIMPIALTILVGLFLVQSRGSGGVGKWFGPVCVLWFLTLAALGLLHLSGDWSMLAACNPLAGVRFLVSNIGLSFVVLGSVFLTVTGAEALYADMGHFGRKPISVAWTWLVFPCLALNYLGQGAFVLAQPSAAANPFFLMAPEPFRPALVILATLATIIASQAVISGAFSLTQQAIQLGLLPRLQIRQTSEHHAGQIYMPQVNWLLMAPFILIECVFFASNMLKLWHGGFVPLLLAAALILVMWTWTRGSRLLAEQTKRDAPLSDVLAALEINGPKRVRGTAVFLTADPSAAPTALMHNLKHNQVLHENVIILTVNTLPLPHAPESERVKVEEIRPDVHLVALSYGFMETPNVPRSLALARAHGLRFDIMTTSFFVSRRALIPSKRSRMPMPQDHLFIFLSRNATNATEFFHIPTARVVELGTQVAI
jgi:KUP system potassium uptake protein